MSFWSTICDTFYEQYFPAKEIRKINFQRQKCYKWHILIYNHTAWKPVWLLQLPCHCGPQFVTLLISSSFQQKGSHRSTFNSKEIMHRSTNTCTPASTHQIQPEMYTKYFAAFETCTLIFISALVIIMKGITVQYFFFIFSNRFWTAHLTPWELPAYWSNGILYQILNQSERE